MVSIAKDTEKDLFTSYATYSPGIVQMLHHGRQFIDTDIQVIHVTGALWCFTPAMILSILGNCGG